MAEEILKRLYTVREAARYLAISRWSVRALIASGKLPCVRQGRRILVDILDMNRYIEDKKQEGYDGDALSAQEA